MNLLLKSMINYALIVLIFSLSETTALHANSIKFKNANELFDSKNYTEAIQNYNDLSTNGVSVNLLFNLGNSYYKAGEVGKALSSYQKALKLAPRNPDLIKNFNFVRKQVPTPPIPITLSQKLIRKLSIDEWIFITAFLSSLFFILMGIKQFYPSHIKNRFWMKISGAIAFIFLLFSLYSLSDYYDDKRAFVTKDIVVHTGPVEQSPESFMAKDGMELFVLGHNGNFINVKSSFGTVGWIDTDAVAFTLP